MQVLTEEERSEAMVEVQKLLAELREYLMRGPVLIEQEPISEATMTALREAAARINQDYDVMVPIEQEALQTVSDHIVSTAISRLCWLMDLSDGERAFVMAAAENARDDVTLAAFADWLEERSLDTEAGRMRRLRMQDGDVLVMTYPKGRMSASMECMRGVRLKLRDAGINVSTVTIPGDVTLTSRLRVDAIRDLAGSTDEERMETAWALLNSIPMGTISSQTSGTIGEVLARTKALENQVADFLEPRKP